MPTRTELVWDGKYDAKGNRVAPLKVALPFQAVETVNEPAGERKTLWSMLEAEKPWRNRLVWGDKKYVLPSLLSEFPAKVNLIYIDPPFDTGADFSFTATVPGAPDDDGEAVTFTKQPSVIEQKAYRDTWGRGIDSYLQWFYETVVILHELLADDGSLYVHLDWHVGHYAKVILDEVFGQNRMLNEIIWYYYNKFQGNINHFASNHDVILYYRKGDRFVFNRQQEKRDKPVELLKRKWDKEQGRIVNAKSEDGGVEYITSTHRTVDDVWRLSMLQPADKTENLRYPTQKPETILSRIISASSNEGDLVLDCFSGSGTTAAVAEKLGRRWIACDLGRFAIHTTRKRLLAIPDVKPFVVHNLGKYERQLWQTGAFATNGPETPQQADARHRAYVGFILNLYHAQPVSGYTWLHGKKGDRFVHVGGVDGPVTSGDVTNLAIEFKKAVGTGGKGPTTNGIDVLGWDFAFEVNELARQQAEASNLQMRFKRIPHDVMDKRAATQGDVHFFEMAALGVKPSVKKRHVTLELTDFVIPPDDVPEDVRAKVTHWSQWIDFWAVDWDFHGDTFHNEWQAFRTKKTAKLALTTEHTYAEPGDFRVMVKVIDILGNDTTKTLTVKVK